MIDLLYTMVCMSVGAAIGIFATKRMIQFAITNADICSEDKRFIRGVLGIPQNGERGNENRH